MSGEEIVNALSLNVAAARKVGLYPGKSGIWETIEQAADLIENQQNHIRALMQTNDALRRGKTLEDRPNIKVLCTMNADRLLELAKADEEDRLFILPVKPGEPMLCQEHIERQWLMKNVTPCIQYQSSSGIVFYMGYDVFRDLVERGRITILSPEEEKTLEGKANV